MFYSKWGEGAEVCRLSFPRGWLWTGWGHACLASGRFSSQVVAQILNRFGKCLCCEPQTWQPTRLWGMEWIERPPNRMLSTAMGGVTADWTAVYSAGNCFQFPSHKVEATFLYKVISVWCSRQKAWGEGQSYQKSILQNLCLSHKLWKQPPSCPFLWAFAEKLCFKGGYFQKEGAGKKPGLFSQFSPSPEGDYVGMLAPKAGRRAVEIQTLVSPYKGYWLLLAEMLSCFV